MYRIWYVMLRSTTTTITITVICAICSSVRCLFEIFNAFSEELNMTVQLTPRDEDAFMQALNRDGPTHVQNALSRIDVESAEASVDSDRALILECIQKRITLSKFNELVRDILLGEYRRMSAGALFSCLRNSSEF